MSLAAELQTIVVVDSHKMEQLRAERVRDQARAKLAELQAQCDKEESRREAAKLAFEVEGLIRVFSTAPSTQTPEADSEHELSKKIPGDAYRGFVTYAFARKLERERNAARAELAELKDRYAKDITELNQRLIDRREAYEAYCKRMKETL